MAFMVWNDRLMTGIAAIDNDHQKLVGMVNALYEAIQAGNGREEVQQVLDDLVDYTRFHFGREEALFTHTRYAGQRQHKAEHDGMVVWVEGIRKRVEEGTAVAPSLEVMNHLKDWLFDHILGSDQRYVEHLMAAGVR
ncbi:MAG TPA: bacteriohemerythrin [Acidobacteriaceae bacterium]|jgi:hemerythrin-like metal-binding protein